MKNEILLINPPFSWNSLKSVHPQGPPLGLAYIARVLEEKRFKSKILDASLGLSLDDIKKEIEINRPEIIGITATTPVINMAYKIAEISKSVDKEIKVIVGGPHPTALPMECIQNQNIDFVVSGEGEYTTLELVDHLINNKGKKSKINGIHYKANEEIYYTEKRGYVQHIDDIPMPAWHLLPMKKYKFSPSNHKKSPSTHLLSSRGCPFGCIFCSKPVTGKKFRAHSPERVVKEIEYLMENYNIKDVTFRDDLFTFDQDRVERICDLMMSKNLKISWSCTSRIDTISKDLLSLMKESGCWGIFFGIETGSERLMKLIKKNITLEQARNVIKWCNQFNIETKIFFILGLPTETLGESISTIDFAKSLNADYAQFSMALPYPDTEFFRMIKSEKKIKSFDWDSFQSHPKNKIVYLPKNRTQSEMLNLQRLAYRKFYFRPSYIFRRLRETNFLHKLKANVCVLKDLMNM